MHLRGVRVPGPPPGSATEFYTKWKQSVRITGAKNTDCFAVQKLAEMQSRFQSHDPFGRSGRSHYFEFALKVISHDGVFYFVCFSSLSGVNQTCQSKGAALGTRLAKILHFSNE